MKWKPNTNNFLLFILMVMSSYVMVRKWKMLQISIWGNHSCCKFFWIWLLLTVILITSQLLFNALTTVSSWAIKSLRFISEKLKLLFLTKAIHFKTHKKLKDASSMLLNLKKLKRFSNQIKTFWKWLIYTMQANRIRKHRISLMTVLMRNKSRLKVLKKESIKEQNKLIKFKKDW